MEDADCSEAPSAPEPTSLVGWIRRDALSLRPSVAQELGTEIKPIPAVIDRDLYCR